MNKQLSSFSLIPIDNTEKSDALAEAFIDPVTGNPLEYENHRQSFSLYGETINIWPG
jgi:hypothetical protein